MSELTWQKTEDGFACERYRIRHLPDRENRSWRLEVLDLTDPRHERRALSTSMHPSLHAAQSRARRDEQDRLRRARIAVHLVVGSGALLVLVGLATLMRHSPFLLVVILMYVGLGSLADAYWIWTNGAWGPERVRGGPKPRTWSDRLVLAAVVHYDDHRIAAVTAEPSAILLLPPEPAQPAVAAAVSPMAVPIANARQRRA